MLAPSSSPPSFAKSEKISSVSSTSSLSSAVLSTGNVVSLQNTDGSWSDRSLITQLAQRPDEVTALAASVGYDIVITKLVLLWLQAQNAGRQYSLIIKKAESWLSKAITDGNIDEAKINAIGVK